MVSYSLAQFDSTMQSFNRLFHKGYTVWIAALAGSEIFADRLEHAIDQTHPAITLGGLVAGSN